MACRWIPFFVKQEDFDYLYMYICTLIINVQNLLNLKLKQQKQL